MSKPNFPPYSGPFERKREYIVMIADTLELGHLRETLHSIGLDVVQVLPQDKDGNRALYFEPLYYFVFMDTEREPTPSTRYYTLATVREICRRIKTGEIDLDALAGAIEAAKDQKQDATEQP